MSDDATETKARRAVRRTAYDPVAKTITVEGKSFHYGNYPQNSLDAIFGRGMANVFTTAASPEAAHAALLAGKPPMARKAKKTDADYRREAMANALAEKELRERKLHLPGKKLRDLPQFAEAQTRHAAAVAALSRGDFDRAFLSNIAAVTEYNRIKPKADEAPLAGAEPEDDEDEIDEAA